MLCLRGWGWLLQLNTLRPRLQLPTLALRRDRAPGVLTDLPLLLRVPLAKRNAGEGEYTYVVYNIVYSMQDVPFSIRVYVVYSMLYAVYGIPYEVYSTCQNHIP